MSVIGHNHIRKVENFDAYEVLAHPLPSRDDRVFRRHEPEGSNVSITYASHDVRIARPTGIGSKGRMAILMHHGRGRFAIEFYESALPIAAALLSLPEREQYALAYAIFEQADECADGARAAEARRWADAFADGRIRKRRSGGKRYVHIETPAEKAIRLS
ncbi:MULTISPECIES: hypothetical protein [Sphingomonadales]|jgi:hypothetical protein|uniref:Uncharacterized protein n=2 Tax=Sphingomonadaceae TaxID=41297 RepID=A0A397PFU5_9SPHN|nr:MULTISPECIES: hypothetical protein [Sphingomonadaceae]EKU73330.1 hypothetical protein HMPREF9718_03799 [Sphingobium yanoikuyae ATCC 51230]RIA46037.1 hypothetical protein DFR49_0566 [Hephaestia caeni]WQE08112.1 hypothetical protein U0025_04290 [Sphingobium yanoikuyae]